MAVPGGPGPPAKKAQKCNQLAGNKEKFLLFFY
jgi:hypothetical protein